MFMSFAIHCQCAFFEAYFLLHRWSTLVHFQAAHFSLHSCQVVLKSAGSESVLRWPVEPVQSRMPLFYDL